MKISPRLFNRFFNSTIVTKVRYGTHYIFRRHLLLANVTISASLSALGDSIQQRYEIHKAPEKKYDLRRTCNMSLSGVTIGVICHFWYIWLDKRFPGRTFLTAVKKMLLDQLICSPITISTFFVTMAVLEGSSPAEFFREVRCKSGKLYLAEWIIWPPAQLINFFLLPLKYRVLYDNTISMCYDVYTSHVKHEVDVDCEGTRSNTNEFTSTSSSKTAELPHPIGTSAHPLGASAVVAL